MGIFLGKCIDIQCGIRYIWSPTLVLLLCVPISLVVVAVASDSLVLGFPVQDFSTIPIYLLCCRLVVELAHSCLPFVGLPSMVAVAEVVVHLACGAWHLAEVVVVLHHHILFAGGISCISRICQSHLPVF